jgi:hypothetical protein
MQTKNALPFQKIQVFTQSDSRDDYNSEPNSGISFRGAVQFPIRRMDCHYLSKTMRWLGIAILPRSFPGWEAWTGCAYHTSILPRVLLHYWVRLNMGGGRSLLQFQ